ICTLQLKGKDEMIINIIEETKEDPIFSQKDEYDANSDDEKQSASLREMDTTELIQRLNTVISTLDVDFNGLNHSEVKSAVELLTEYSELFSSSNAPGVAVGVEHV
ncbi:MAG: hypothetical protein NTY03_04105, partial [Candidatus Bathyarchaeota archaeon]|nr:hypothetical protein [Candidatus Bathyarchaeota archaeon]